MHNYQAKDQIETLDEETVYPDPPIPYAWN